MKKFLPYFIIFTLATALFFWLQSSPTLGDGDSFYHAKITELIIQQRGPIKNFPWLPLTTLKDHYADHHFLFHIYLIPFILIFKNSLIAIKVATVLLAAVFFVVFYWLLRRWKIQYAFIYSLLPLVSYVMPYRLALAKEPAASLIILCFGLAALLSRKKLPLFVISFIFVWLHGAWPVILVATVIYCLAVAIKNIIDQPPEIPEKFKNQILKIKNWKLEIGNWKFYLWHLFRCFFTKSNTGLLLACVLGLAAGLIINPYFPQNLYFYWEQIFKVAVLNAQSKIAVGAEWYPYEPFLLVANNLLIVALWVFAVAWFVVSVKKPQKTFPELQQLEPQLGQTRESFFFCLLSAAFFIYTIKSRRMAEYFIPLAVLFAAFTFNRCFKTAPWRDWWHELKKFILDPRFIILNLLLLLLFVVGLGGFLGYNLRLYQNVQQSMAKARPFDNFQKASQFLKSNTPAGSIILHSSWDYFPMLFYYNDQNYYITGLDSTFFYDKNPKLYNLWRNIVLGKEKDNLAEKIKTNFNSQSVLVDPKNSDKFDKNLSADSSFELIYQDNEAKIYRIK